MSSFFMGRYEVTNAQVAEVFQWAYDNSKVSANSSTVQNNSGNPQELLDLDGSGQISFSNGTFSVDSSKDDFPCVEITWYGSVAFCNYLSEKEDLTPCYDLSNWSCDWSKNGYRLPTEAEWEYAARGGSNGDNTRYSGSDTVDLVAWFFGNSGGHSHETGTKAANELGIFDMSGNVWEWCWDWYTSYPSRPQTNPYGPESGTRRVIRGGSWFNSEIRCCVSYRLSNYPDLSSISYGFRLVRAPVC